MPRTCIVLKWMVSPRDCASYHTDSQEISAFIPECEEKLSVTLACKHSWPRVLRGRHTRVQDAGVMCCGAGAQSMERSVPPVLMGSWGRLHRHQGDRWIFLRIQGGREQALQAEAGAQTSSGALSGYDASTGQGLIPRARGKGSCRVRTQVGLERGISWEGDCTLASQPSPEAAGAVSGFAGEHPSIRHGPVWGKCLIFRIPLLARLASLNPCPSPACWAN